MLMEETESKKSDFEIVGLSLLDVSSENDCLLNSPFVDPIRNQLSENQNRILELLDTMHNKSEETPVSSLEDKEQILKLHKSPEPEKSLKNEKYNLRKSLAWDNAFFTSAGFLDAEELSSMIEGKEKSEKHALPVIQEDVHRSTDSISTFGSDNLTIESLEAGLFEDIRASIQKSSNASDVAILYGKRKSGLTEAATTPSSNKMDLVSRNKMKSKVAPKKPSVGIQGSGKTVKQVFVHPQVLQSIAARGEHTSSVCKPPKVLSRVNPISTTSTKRASLDVSRVKREKDAKISTVADRRVPVSKTPALASTRNILPRSTPLLKSSLRSSTATKKELTTSCSSFDSCGSTSSDSVRKSSLNSIKRKNDFRLANPSSSGSTARTPSRVASRSKFQQGNSQLSAHLTPVTKLSCSTSPASSVSEWSSESSTTSTVKQRAHSSRASLESSSCERVSIDNDSPNILNSQNHSSDQSSVGHGVQVTELLGESVKRVSTCTSGLVHPASMKPSGLRMPSPKIGFFDGVRTVVRTPDGNMQSHPRVPSGFSKHGTASPSPSGSSNITNSGKIQSARTPTAICGTKHDVHQTASKMKLTSSLPLQESSNSATKFSSASRNVKSVSGSSLKVQNRMSPKTRGEKHLKDEGEESKGGNRAMNDPDFGSEEKSNAPTCLKDKVSSGRKGIKITPVNEEPEDTDDRSSISGVDNISSSPKVGKDGNQREKIHFEDQVDKLTRQVGAMDINMEIGKEPTGDSLSLICGQKEQCLRSSSKPTLTLSATAFDSMTSNKMPLAVNNSSHNMLDVSTGLTVKVEKIATSPFPESNLTDCS